MPRCAAVDWHACVCACRYSADAEKAANRAVASSQGLIDQLRAVQLAALDAAPQEVKNSTWYQQFREGVNNFNQTGESAERAWVVDLVAAAQQQGRCGLG